MSGGKKALVGGKGMGEWEGGGERERLGGGGGEERHQRKE